MSLSLHFSHSVWVLTCVASRHRGGGWPSTLSCPKGAITSSVAFWPVSHLTMVTVDTNYSRCDLYLCECNLVPWTKLQTRPVMSSITLCYPSVFLPPFFLFFFFFFFFCRRILCLSAPFSMPLSLSLSLWQPACLTVYLCLEASFSFSLCFALI